MRPEVVASLIALMFGIGSMENVTSGMRVGSENDSDRIMTTVLSVRLAVRVALMSSAAAA